MRHRFFPVISIVFSLLISYSESSIAAQPVAGGVCSKAGSTQIYKNKKFTCIKSGKKTIWNKGATIPNPNPSPKPTPTPTPAPTPAPTPTQQPVVVPLWQQTQFEIFRELKALKPDKVQILEFILSPKTNKDTAQKLQDAYQEPITLLSNLYVNPKPVTFLVMNETEHDWWWEQVQKLSTTMEQSWWGGMHCNPNMYSHCGYGTSPNADGSFSFGQIIGSSFRWTNSDHAISTHEAIHVYQLGMLGTRMNVLPTWFAEGQANYLGFTFSHNYLDSKSQRDTSIIGLIMNFKEVVSYSKKDWAVWLQKIDSDYEYTFRNSLGYSVGELLLEDIYNTYGYQKVHQWLLEIKNGSSAKDGFKKVFGIEYDQWLSNSAAEYLDSQVLLK